MRARIRFIAPLAVAVALTAACGDSGSSGTGGDSGSGGTASGEACAPVAGDKLVVLEDDQHLQNADNVIPAVNTKAADGQPALLPALNAVSAVLTTEDLVNMNAAVDVDRKSAEEVAAAWVQQSGVTDGLEHGSGPVAVGGAGFTESTILANVYADVLKAAGFDATVREVGSRELYLKALTEGSEIQVFPEYVGSLATFLNGSDPSVASSDLQKTVDNLTRLGQGVGLAFGDPSQAADQNGFAITTALAKKLGGITSLSDLADKCGDGSLVLGGPTECPTRPFCQPGLEDKYGMKFSDVQDLDIGTPINQGLVQGVISIGLVLTTDPVLAK